MVAFNSLDDLIKAINNDVNLGKEVCSRAMDASSVSSQHALPCYRTPLPLSLGPSLSLYFLGIVIRAAHQISDG